jgi:hypothetical protein
MFSMQFITNFTIRSWEAEIFKKMCSQNAGNAISETHILEISLEGLPQPRSQGFSLFVIGKAGKGPGTGRSSTVCILIGQWQVHYYANIAILD